MRSILLMMGVTPQHMTNWPINAVKSVTLRGRCISAIFLAHTPLTLLRQSREGGREGRRARRARDVWWGSQAAAPASSRLKPLTVQPTPLPPLSRLALPLQRGLKPNKEKVKPFQIYRTVLFKIESNPAMRQGYVVTKVRIGKDLTS